MIKKDYRIREQTKEQENHSVDFIVQASHKIDWIKVASIQDLVNNKNHNDFVLDKTVYL